MPAHLSPELKLFMQTAADGERCRLIASLKRNANAGDLARLTGTRPAPWLSPVTVSRKMLGLPSAVNACLFDLDGVLTDSGVLHALAWAEAFDGFHLAQVPKILRD